MIAPQPCVVGGGGGGGVITAAASHVKDEVLIPSESGVRSPDPSHVPLFHGRIKGKFLNFSGSQKL